MPSLGALQQNRPQRLVCYHDGLRRLAAPLGVFEMPHARFLLDVTHFTGGRSHWACILCAFGCDGSPMLNIIFASGFIVETLLAPSAWAAAAVCGCRCRCPMTQNTEILLHGDAGTRT